MRLSREKYAAFGLVVLLGALLSVEWLREMEFSNVTARSVQETIIVTLLSPHDQAVIFAALLVYFFALLWIRVLTRRNGADSNATFKDGLTMLDWCRIVLMGWATLSYAVRWTGNTQPGSVSNLRLGIDQTTNALVLLSGIVVGCVVETVLASFQDRKLVYREQEHGIRSEGAATTPRQRGVAATTQAILYSITLLLGAASLLKYPPPHLYKYHHVVRQTGLWANPNTFGLLMGVGFILAVGQMAANSRATFRTEKSGINWLKFLPLLIAAGLCGLGLVKSYSRGAWLATACAAVFLGTINVQRACLEASAGMFTHAVRRNWLPLTLLAGSLLITGFWHFRFANMPLVRRVFSVSNLNDFSWRNRVTVWRGSVRMLADRPLLGYGWGQVEGSFAKSPYRAPRLQETMAIQLNDFFTLGLSAGVPALLSFLGCAGMALFPGVSRPKPIPRVSASQTQHVFYQTRCPFRISTACRAASVLMLAAFWFDGGLFRLATGPLFWTLLVLSQFDEVSVPGLVKASPSGRKKRWEVTLRFVAGFLVVLATGETVFHLALPRLTVRKSSLLLARKYLVRPADQADFDYLATSPMWTGRPLGVLLEHVQLADYNRRLVSWRTDGQLFRKFVLNPKVEPQFDGAMNWRQPLWEYFYPRIRRETDPDSASQIVVQLLRRRVKLASESKPASIREMWEQHQADTTGFQALLTAALRSVGVPARLNSKDQTEFWDGTKWKTAPLPPSGFSDGASVK